MNFTLSAWGLVFIAGINTCIANLLLKRSRLEAPDPGLFSLLFSPWFIGGLVFFGINVIIFAKALDKLPVSAAYPVLSGMGFGLIAVGSNYFFGERLALNQYIGLAVILTGIIIMSRP
ncbi:small multidrug resistance protein [Nostoc calcicola FACHB-389]|nr:small multidrug resistance protein [Nostoc calcicola FACHB-3891]MDZ8059434.1 SMR family transporter [Nostoc sp. EkiNYC01]OKH21541.1 small multidrug resistance protein [Nostoc calcicola FACHB-389]